MIWRKENNKCTGGPFKIFLFDETLNDEFKCMENVGLQEKPVVLKYNYPNVKYLWWSNSCFSKALNIKSSGRADD